MEQKYRVTERTIKTDLTATLDLKSNHKFNRCLKHLGEILTAADP